MAFAPETIKLLRAAKELVKKIPADAVLILADGPMEWDKVLEELSGTRILVAARHEDDFVRIKDHPDLTLIEIESGPTPTQERMSLALLEAVRSEKLRQGAEVVVLYNGIEVGEEKPDMIDTLSLIKLGEHLEKLKRAGSSQARYSSTVRNPQSRGRPCDRNRQRRQRRPPYRHYVCRGGHPQSDGPFTPHELQPFPWLQR